MKPGMVIDGPTVLAAVALSLQNIILEIEANGGPDRQVFANRIRSQLTENDEKNPIGYSLSLIAKSIEQQGPRPPELRIV